VTRYFHEAVRYPDVAPVEKRKIGLSDANATRCSANGKGERDSARCGSIFQKTLMSGSVPSVVYNKTFSMTTSKAAQRVLRELGAARAGVIGSPRGKAGKNFAGEFNVSDRFIARVAVAAIARQFVPLVRATPKYKPEKIKTSLAVLILGVAPRRGRPGRYLNSSKKIDIAI